MRRRWLRCPRRPPRAHRLAQLPPLAGQTAARTQGPALQQQQQQQQLQQQQQTWALSRLLLRLPPWQQPWPSRMRCRLQAALLALLRTTRWQRQQLWRLLQLPATQQALQQRRPHPHQLVLYRPGQEATPH
jgi:hypothetical protein